MVLLPHPSTPLYLMSLQLSAVKVRPDSPMEYSMSKGIIFATDWGKMNTIFKFNHNSVAHLMMHAKSSV